MSTNTVPIPFSEPPWLNGFPSPYYTESHRRWQKACRAFITENLHQHVVEWDNTGEVPEWVWEKFVKANMLIPSLPSPLPVEMLKKLGIPELLGVVKVEEFDYLHGMIYGDEMARSGVLGPSASLTTGISFGVPPIIKYGSPSLQARYLPDLLLGRTRACLAITEPSVGSDVANISTTATLSADGKHYVVNGTKKWITNGIWADVATMAVRTGGPDSGPLGLSLLVVPLKNTEGVKCRKLSTLGQRTAGTTFITLDDVLVPRENLIGQEGAGMKYIMTNFNHERLSIAIGATRQSRVALSTAFEYVMKRKAFGRPLIDQAVVRHRLAKAGAQLESLWAWIEAFAWQMTQLPKPVADARLGGLTALAKAQAGMVLDECARTAVLLFGGSGFTESGVGEVVQKIYREVPAARIPGGSEDVLLDLAVRQLLKGYQAEMKKLGRGAKM